jgi:hypothetical protein
LEKLVFRAMKMAVPAVGTSVLEKLVSVFRAMKMAVPAVLRGYI